MDTFRCFTNVHFPDWCSEWNPSSRGSWRKCCLGSKEGIITFYNNHVNGSFPYIKAKGNYMSILRHYLMYYHFWQTGTAAILCIYLYVPVIRSLFLTLINFNPEWISNQMPSKVWSEITSPFPNFKGNVEVWNWVYYFMPHFIIDVITYP